MNIAPIESLSNELLRLILDQIEPDPEKTVPIDRRQFLSIESFDRPPPSQRGSLRDICNFRRTSRRFAAVGEPLLFTRVSGRFSRRGLEKLETLASWSHLTRHVKKFSYLVPYFYREDLTGEVAGEPRSLNGPINFDLEAMQQKAREQQEIRESGRDVEILKKAIASFSSLQLVQLLRVTDEEDDRLLSYLEQNADSNSLVWLEWAPACSHGSRTIGAALLAADVPWYRFSSPMLSPQSVEFLASHRPHQLPALAERLTCLALHFDDGQDLDEKMRELSSLFKTVFMTAKGMQAVHVGFPSHRPLSLPLEAVFHHVTWEKLVAFGVQGWNLDADEILDLVLRHKFNLKGLRLRDVHLNEGSMWKDVLGTLRRSMHRLEWVSLRRIDYTQHFETVRLSGVEILDDPLLGQSESESESEEEEDEAVPGPSSHDTVNGTHHDTQSDSFSESDDEHGPDANDLEFPPLNSPKFPVRATWCNCHGSEGISSSEDLGDDGSSVSNSKRKAWERWVVGRCPEHSSRPP